jgi:type I restriction enzyme S subunit
MNATELLDHFERLADAPDAISRLRHFVLDLAVRGKLVEQNPKDKSAAELRKQILAEEKKHKEKEAAEISAEDEPFVRPTNWEWVRLGESLIMINGRAFKPTEWQSQGLPIVRIQNLNSATAPFNYCDASKVEERHVIETGCFLISWSGTPGTSFGAFIWNRGRAALNQHIFKCVPIGGAFDDRFLRLAINGRLDEMIAKAHGGVGLQHITKGKLENLVLCLPPLTEQRLIVAKFDELMALCDRLEAAQADRENRRNRLVRASLHRLNQPADAHTFRAHARFALDNLPRLTTRPEHVPQLRQTILNLAVRGKLIPQDPNDEPASDLLAKDTMLPEGHQRRRKILKKTAVDAPENPFPVIPTSWKYTDVQTLYEMNVIVDYADGNHGSLYPRASEFGDSGVNFVTAKDLADGRILWGSCSKLNQDRAKQLVKGWARGGDVLLTHNATVGRVAQVEPEIGLFLLGTSVTFYRLNSDVILPRFFFYLLKSTLWQGQLEAIMAQTTRNQVSIQKQAFFRVVVAPLAEQRRIVAKVDELMALCDRLEAQFTTTQTESRRLLESVLHEALA